MSVLQVSLIAMVAVLLAIQLKGGRAEYGFLINLAAGIFLFFCIVGKLEVFIRAVEQIQSFLTLDTEYIAIMLKMVGITYIAQFSSGICKDAGYQAIAAQIEIFGKLAILVVGMPVTSCPFGNNSGVSVMRKYGIFGILFLSLCLFGAVHTAYAAEEEESLQITQEELLDEFDFSDLDDSLKKMFPREKMTFRDVVETLVSGDLKKAGEQFTGFLFDQFFYELQTHRKLLVYLILIAVIAAVFANFSGAFGERQASEIAFYILYMLLIALCLNGFRLAVSEMEASLNFLLEFMKVLCPTYFLAVTAASGSVTSMFFFEVVLFLIFLAEAVILNFLVPLVNVYMMIQVMGNLTGEEFLSQFAELLEKLTGWTLKTMLACVIGINVVQGILSPALDSLKRSFVTKTVEAIPGLGNMAGSVMDVVLGTAVLIKNGIGMAGAVIAAGICIIPIVKLLLLAFLYKTVAAVTQPISDKRITACIGGVSEGYEMLVKVMATTGILFLLTIAVVAASAT